MGKKAAATWLTLFMAVLFTATQAQGDTIKIPVGQQSPDLQGLTKPAQGMSKTAVRQQFGDPQSATPAVGKPPISSWTYQNFEVYFEDNHVIHSVLKHTPPKPIRVPAENAKPQ